MRVACLWPSKRRYGYNAAAHAEIGLPCGGVRLPGGLRFITIKELEMTMKRLMRILLPGWEGFTCAQRAACVDFGVSACVFFLLCCSESFALTVLGLVNVVRSYLRLSGSGVEIDE